MLKQILEELNIESEYNELYKTLEQKTNSSVFGATLPDKVLFLNSVDNKILYVAENVKEAQLIKEQFEILGKRTGSIYYKMSGYIHHTAERNLAMQDYYKNLFNLASNKLDVLVVTPEVLMQKLPSKLSFEQNILKLTRGASYDFENLNKKLIQMGYKKQEMVENEGDFSIRGDILDVFPTNSKLPYRVQFFDEEIENIKTFNAVTYTTISDVESISISPNTLIFLTQQELEEVKKNIRKEVEKLNLEPNFLVRINNIVEDVLLNLGFNSRDISLAWCLPFIGNYSAGILDYFSKGSIVIFNSTKQITDEIDLLYKEFNESVKNLISAGEILKQHKKFYFSKKQLLESFESYTKIAYQNLNFANKLFNPEQVFSLRVGPIINYSKNYKLLLSDLNNYIKAEKTVLMAGENNSSSVYLQKYLKEKNISANIITNIDQIEKEQINILTQKIDKGFSLTAEQLIIIGSSQLFGKKVIKKIRGRGKKNVFTMPKVGDYVVHDTHGIGLCEGIERLKLSGYEKDYILIKYAGGDMLYLPSEQVELISSFIGSDKEPKLNKIGGAQFQKAKDKVKKSVKEMAFNLLELYAKRQKTKGFKFLPDNLLQQEFEKAFPYTETEDQIKAINNIKADMESDKTMDRLICGDVGYGKTEVALRGAFKAITSGKQVAFLAPTTILAQQHYNTCVARMKEFMINCDVLSRFKSSKEIKESLERLKDGTTNIICGTHRLLSKDVKFKDLGLLILDEEQRFGVADKEKIKELKKNIDVITMSATPIPRTLHMSMIGIRDISLIETPPKNRLPVQTFVTEYSNALIKDAVNREILRGGQVLIVHNRVETIYSIFEKLKGLFSNVSMDVAHGQMNKKQLENVIKDLYDGKIQLLLATTLIENGIDLPNANTLIILNSDRLGLSQLYQLRGRVGRSNRLGYAYFTYEKQKVLTESAYKRLNAINEFTELGSGFKIALRDLEIRGAGNILGREQHGHMGKVGYDMYCKILSEAVSELKGEQRQKLREIKINIALNSYIPSSYISENSNRFRVYSSLGSVETVIQQQEALKEIEDIYGPAPSSVVNLANAALIKNLGEKAGIKKVVINKKCLIEFYDKEKALSDEVNKAIGEFKSIAVLKFENSPIIEFNLEDYSVLKKQDTVLKFLTLCS